MEIAPFTAAPAVAALDSYLAAVPGTEFRRIILHFYFNNYFFTVKYG